MVLSRKLHIDLSFHAGIWATRSNVGFCLFIKHIPLEGHLGEGFVHFQHASSQPWVLDVYRVPSVAVIPTEASTDQTPRMEIKSLGSGAFKVFGLYDYKQACVSSPAITFIERN